MIRVLSGDSDVLLVYCVHRASLQCKVQMEQWGGTVLSTCTDLGQIYIQLLGMHSLSGYGTVRIHMAREKSAHSQLCSQGISQD